MYKEHYVIQLIEGDDVVTAHVFDLNEARIMYIRTINMVFHKLSDDLHIEHSNTGENFRGNVDLPWIFSIGNIKVILSRNDTVSSGPMASLPLVECSVYYDGHDEQLLGYAMAPSVQLSGTTFIHLPLMDAPTGLDVMTLLCARVTRDPISNEQTLLITHLGQLPRWADFRRSEGASDGSQ